MVNVSSRNRESVTEGADKGGNSRYSWFWAETWVTGLTQPAFVCLSPKEGMAGW